MIFIFQKGVDNKNPLCYTLGVVLPIQHPKNRNQRGIGTCKHRKKSLRWLLPLLCLPLLAAESAAAVYVSTVAELNAANPDLTTLCYSGVTEAQETKEIKADTSKTIAETYVKEGDTVKKGTPLFLYDVASMQLDLEQGQIEVEQLNNQIASYQEQIQQLESEKANADADQQLSYTTQIQSLQTDIDKAQYDIKVKNIALQKQQNAIDNAKVTAEMDGIVKTVKTPEAMQADGTDVIMTITASGNYRIKGTLSEQQLGMVSTGEKMVIRSRIDPEQYWTGTVTEIGTEAEQNSNNNMMYDSSSSDNTASKYAFYIKLDKADGLLLGQHVLIEPDVGQNSGHTGIWLYQDYLVQDGDNSYVWVSNSKHELEKKSVTLGDTDDNYGIVELKSGLSETDLIAYPADDYKEGMKTTTNANNLSNGETDGDFSDEEPIEEPMYDQEEPMIEETEEAAAEDAVSGR